jgi:signal transduction histidine kinase
MLDVALQLGSTLTLDQLLSKVVERFGELIGAELSLFLLCDGDGAVLRSVDVTGSWSDDTAALEVSTGLIEQVVKTRQILSMRNVGVDEQLGVLESVRALGIRLFVGVPIVWEDEVLGVLYGASPELRPSRVSEPDRELLQAISHVVGMAVQNARLYEEQRLRSRLMATMAHDLRTPLSIILLNADFLSSESEGTESQVSAADIGLGAQQMKSIIDNTLSFSRLDAGAGRSVSVVFSLGDVLSDVKASYSMLASRFNFTLNVWVDPEIGEIWGLPDRVRVVLDNLVSNAFKHATKDSIVSLRAELSASDTPEEPWALAPNHGGYFFTKMVGMVPTANCDWVHISVHNHGPAIPPALQSTIFDEYGIGHSGRSALGGSSGLGLSIAAMCASRLGGRAWVLFSDVEKGTSVGFSLPTRLRP